MADIGRIRARLEQRLAELTTRVSQIESQLRDPGAKDSEERALEVENDEVLERLDEAGLSELREIQAALRRMESGRYGTCESCGDPIAPGRLEVLPYTHLCIDCA